MSYHLLLGQKLVTDLKYLEWAEMRHYQGDFLIVDNGAAEPEQERVPFENILKVALNIYADEIVVPDVIRNSELTLEMARHWGPTIPLNKRLIIPQGRDLEEWKSCFLELKHLLSFVAVGIPKHAETFKGGRAAILMWLHEADFCRRSNIHLFGCHTDPLEEIRQAIRICPEIRGIDTGAAVAYAQVMQPLTCGKHFGVEWDKQADPRSISYNMCSIANCIEEELNAYNH